MPGERRRRTRTWLTEDTPQKKEDQASQKDKGEKEEEAAIEIELDFGSDPETYASPPKKKKQDKNMEDGDLKIP